MVDSDSRVNSGTEEFLGKWDRSLNDDRRCYGIKLCLAGAESKKVRDGLYRIGVRHILVSYYYIHSWLRNRPVQEIAEDFGRFDFVFLDSGGFTFLQELAKGKESKVDIVDYTKGYYEELKRVGKVFAGCAEVDLPDQVGTEFSEDARKELWELGVPIIPVLRGKPVSFYERLGWFETYPYMAIGSQAIKDPTYAGHMHNIIKKCREKNVLLHGFGATDKETLYRSEFYSVDSTTWNGGSRFGDTMVFENGKIRHFSKDRKHERERYRKRFEENGVIWDDIVAEKGFEVDMMNALAWKQLSDYLKYSATRCYWLTAEEKSRALTLKTKAFNAEGIIDRKTSLARAEARRLTQVTDADYDDRAHEILHCDTCKLEGRCPRYKEGEPCGYDVNIRLETKADLQKALRILLETQYGRVMTGVLFEKVHGGELNRDISNEIQRLVTLVQQVRGIFEPNQGDELHISAKSSSGALSSMLASVFSPTGTGGSGSGVKPVQRAAAKVIDVSPIDDPSIEES